jgi:hypothetical protein
LHFYYAADDEVTDFGDIAGSEGEDGEQFVGFEDGAEDGAVD